jgi:hypothetical protein
LPGIWSLDNLFLVDAAGNHQRIDSLLLSWPAWAASFPLESQGNIGQPNTWAPVGLAPVVLGEDAVVAVPVSAGRKFYRLAEHP